jgi:hypothetical protein
MQKRMSFEQAKRFFVNRYTVEHVPVWARIPCSNGKFYAPQFISDWEWYQATKFPGDTGYKGRKYCETSNPTFPLGQWLDSAFTGKA